MAHHNSDELNSDMRELEIYWKVRVLLAKVTEDGIWGSGVARWPNLFINFSQIVG
jgi:hypothetical protein